MARITSEFGRYSLIDLEAFEKDSARVDDFTLFDVSSKSVTNKNSILFFRHKFKYLSMDFENPDIFFWSFSNMFERSDKRHPLFCDVSDCKISSRDQMNRNADYRPNRNISGLSSHTYNVFRSASCAYYVAQARDLNLASAMVRESNPRNVRNVFMRAKKENPDSIIKITKQEDYDLIMSINRAKFSCYNINQRLIRTGLRTIFNVANKEEKNNFQGINRNEKPSLNILGKVLMTIRHEYQMSRSNEKDSGMKYPEDFLDVLTSDDSLFNIVDTEYINELEREFESISANEKTREERNGRSQDEE